MGQEMESFENFMKNELVKYIHAELLKGHSPIAIKETLIKGGHQDDMIDEVLNILKESNYDINVALRKGASGRILKQDMFYDILNAVIKYIELMLEQGHDIHSIEHMLYKFGHSKVMINRAIDAVLFGQKGSNTKEPETVSDYVALAEKFIFPLLIVIYIVLCLLISSVAGAGIDRVLLGFIALFFSILVGGILSPKLNSRNRTSLFALPVLFAVLFYFLGNAGLELFSRLDVPRLSVLNVLFGLLFMAVLIVTAIDKEENEGKNRSGRGSNQKKDRKHNQSAHTTHWEEEPIPLLGKGAEASAETPEKKEIETN